MGLFSKGYFGRLKRRVRNTLKNPLITAAAGFIPGGAAIKAGLSGLVGGGGANNAPAPRFSGRSAVSGRSAGGAGGYNGVTGGSGRGSINPLVLVAAAVAGIYFIMG